MLWASVIVVDRGRIELKCRVVVKLFCNVDRFGVVAWSQFFVLYFLNEDEFVI